MQHEYEATFLSIDVTGLQAKLTALGAIRVFPRRLLTRRIFENGALERGAWIRLRDEGERSTLTLKQVTDPTSIDGTTEIETEVTDLRAMADILTGLDLAEVRYQENYREDWHWEEVAFDFDTWPDLPTFVEIRSAGRGLSPSRRRCRRARLLSREIWQRRRDLQERTRARHPR